MQVQFNVQDKDVKAMLLKLQSKTGNLKPALRDIGIYMKKEVMDNFAAEGRPNRWHPLSKKYAARKAASMGAGKPILEFHGKLKQSINVRTGTNKTEVNTGVKYGVYHQTGTRKMVARPFMPDRKNQNIPPFHTGGINYIKRIIQLYLTG